eukprot:TRINITY_DN2709_c0_g4_i1.p2 TRINITY_DN2709_c0_g4~~TRINITY_DN2709_c0_g4_i1.p2  ORF type:complete len:219 (+),score=108.35 TRINITY_DN2709_c0_g4_i1:102-758(+)
MDATAAQGQIQQMISFILAEAEDKAAEIQKKGEEEFSIEVHRIITEQKDKVRKDFEKKSKAIETAYAIAKSTAINKQRLEKIKKRQEMMNQIAADVKVKLSAAGQDKAFVTKLIVQGLLMFLEDNVDIRCRQKDMGLVQTCLADAAAQYKQIIKKQAGVDKTVNLKIDQSQFVPDSSLGGVVLACGVGKITIDNTINLRLNLAMEQDKPAIRKILFPQ